MSATHGENMNVREEKKTELAMVCFGCTTTREIYVGCYWNQRIGGEVCFIINSLPAKCQPIENRRDV